MRWRYGRRSSNVEDRRGLSFSRGAKIGGMGGVGLLIMLVLSLLFDFNPGTLLQGDQEVDWRSTSHQERPGGHDELKDFVSVVLADTEDVWTEVFARSDTTYPPPQLVLFSGAVQSACGIAGSAVGPFYCPLDRKVYLDLSFFQDLRSRFGAPGDFAQAYIIAHEVGHHVQNVLGISEKVRKAQSSMGASEANRLSVKMELQADCLAGVWGNHAERTRRILEAGDVEEGLNAASAIGDDRIQRQTQGNVIPDAFTHGTSAQRVRWFKKGLDSGRVQACNTFESGVL